MVKHSTNQSCCGQCLTMKGFTLIEIMIALALGTLVLLGLSVLFSVNSGNQNELERTLRKLENARFALDTLSEDIMHAGYFSDVNPNTLIGGVTYQTPSPCETGLDKLGWDSGTTPIKMPTPIQGISNTDNAFACLNNRVKDTTEAFVIRHADTGSAISPDTVNVKNLYIQISRCPDDLQRIIVSPGEKDNFILRTATCDKPFDAVRRLIQRAYYIADCNDCDANDGIPTLKRIELIDGILRTISIAEGIENLQMEYGEDTDGDGQPNNFVTTDKVTDWANVIAVRLHLLARATEKTTGYEDARTYKLGPDVTVTKPADGFKRTLMTTTVRLNNVGGRRE
jgi:type IV pilus assembly protein PilW